VAVVVAAGAFAVVAVVGGDCSACRAFSSTSALLRVMAETFESAMVADSSSSVKLEAGLPWMLCGRGAFMRNLSRPNCCSVSTLTSGPGVRVSGSLVSVGSTRPGAKGGRSPVNAGSLGMPFNSPINASISFLSAGVICSEGKAYQLIKPYSTRIRRGRDHVLRHQHLVEITGQLVRLRQSCRQRLLPGSAGICARSTRAVCVGLMMFASYD
jgi:hypothetical protein